MEELFNIILTILCQNQLWQHIALHPVFLLLYFHYYFLPQDIKKHLRKNTRKARIQDYVPFLLVPYECSPLAPLVFFIWCNFLIYPWVNSNRNANGMKSRHEAFANERKAALHAANYLPSTEASVLSRDERKTRLTSPLLLPKKAQQSIESSFQKGSLVICLAAHAPVPNDLSSTTGWPNLHSNESLGNTDNTLSLFLSNALTVMEAWGPEKNWSEWVRSSLSEHEWLDFRVRK